ncbi:hypothetical protein V8E51_011894 [Hyaloscypha variabilis]
MLLESDRASRYLSHSRIYLSLTLRANVDSSRMHLWFWVPMAFLCFINVTSLPMNREGALDESRGIDQRSYVPRRELSEIITARIVHQEKGQPEEESVDYGQKRLESLRISTGAKLGHILVQPEHTLRSVLWSWPSHMAGLIKRQIICGNNSQCGNGANSTGNGDGVGNNVTNVTSGGSGSSQTDRNIALGVGLGVGLPGAIVAMVTILKYFRR